LVARSIARRAGDGVVHPKRAILSALEFGHARLDQARIQLFGWADLFLQRHPDAGFGADQIAGRERRLRVSPGEPRAPHRRDQAQRLGALAKLGSRLGELAQLHRQIRSPQRRRGVLHQRRRGEVSVGLGIAAREGAGDAAKPTKLRIVQLGRR
jgi:hypothetical protein